MYSIPNNNQMNGIQMMNYNNIPMMNNPYQPKMDRYMELQQNYQQQTQVPQSNSNISFLIVSNMQEAKEKVIPYNYTMWMRDSSLPYLYIKSVDQVGTPNFKILKLEEITESFLQQNQQETIEYVSINEFNQLATKVEQLNNTINHYNNILNTKQDTTIVDVESYDIKKPTKKVGDK